MRAKCKKDLRFLRLYADTIIPTGVENWGGSSQPRLLANPFRKAKLQRP